ncbi:NAD(P)H-binding protein [Fructobacillus sp. CRL 2054]|uniref:NAD(P)H-binding protein n=1 Tax=Fructobacillus sp. CRL 2054 TaxID=2763007 RepID=UPI002378896E|nr:NAD(P)H-binding protein [Fructobacillus sp. CRL 2054]MDD9138906.1 NAD(P)H-binding protein [Fructobacillus sp. CRL 2054]
MKILILGAAGQIARLLTERLLKESNDQLTLYARRANERLSQYQGNPRVKVVDGDFSNEALLEEIMSGQDVVFVDSDHDTEPILKAMKATGVKRIIIAGVLGVYGEVAGKFGEWNRSMIGNVSPERRENLKKIEESGLDYTYMRMTWLYNQPGNVSYATTQKGEPFVGAQVSRQAIVQYVFDLLANPKKDIQASVGIYEPGSEKMDKPSFY